MPQQLTQRRLEPSVGWGRKDNVPLKNYTQQKEYSNKKKHKMQVGGPSVMRIPKTCFRNLLIPQGKKIAKETVCVCSSPCWSSLSNIKTCGHSVNIYVSVGRFRFSAFHFPTEGRRWRVVTDVDCMLGATVNGEAKQTAQR